MCRDFAPEFDPELIKWPSDLVNRCRLLCVLGGDPVSSCVSPGLFDQALSQPALLDPGILVATGVHFDVFGMGIGDSVRACPLLWMSVDTGDGDQLPVTTAARPLAGGSGCCGWLQFVMQGQGLWLLQSACGHAPSCLVMETGRYVSGLCTLSRDQLQSCTASPHSLVLPDCCVFSLVQ